MDGGTITTQWAAIAPFGAPDRRKKGDSILTNVISRIAAIKEREHQAARSPTLCLVGRPSERDVTTLDYSHQLQPLMSWNGEVQSGGYWHALYGRRGDTILESGGGRIRTNVMQHEGRYYQKMKEHGGPTRISGFVSSPKTTVIMEHPAAALPLTASFRKQLINLPWFDIGLSLANRSEHLVERTVHVQREFIVAIIAALGFSAS